MSYIKFTLSRLSDEVGNTLKSSISRIQSDLPSLDTSELPLIMHALSAPGGKVQLVTDFILDSSRLDNDLLG